MSVKVVPNAFTRPPIARRDFLKTTTAAAAGLTIVPRHVLGAGMTAPSDKLNIAGIGVGGMGRVNLTALSTENIVALCDVDWDYAGRTLSQLPAEIQEREGQVKSLGSEADRKEMLDWIASTKRLAEQVPKSTRYTDYREMLDKQKDIDAVMVAQSDLVEPLARFEPRLVKMAPSGEPPED